MQEETKQQDGSELIAADEAMDSDIAPVVEPTRPPPTQDRVMLVERMSSMMGAQRNNLNRSMREVVDRKEIQLSM